MAQDLKMKDLQIQNRMAFATRAVDGRVVQGEDIHDPREKLTELEETGQAIIHHITDENKPVEVELLHGWKKLIPTNKLWQHKSCGQCGHIPGYVTSLYWLFNLLGTDYFDETNQTSCTAWNYHGSATSNVVALAAVAVRNFHRAYQTDYYPLIHCATSFGDYKEMRNMLVHSEELRDEVRRILKKIGRDLVIPEEIVHYSDWLHVMRFEIAEHKKYDVGHIITTVHPGCHTWKMIPEDCIYDKTIYNGKRPAPTTSNLLAMDAQVADYSTWADCCGFGFRHILTEREFSRSFALQRKIKPMVDEANSDVCITQDTGCTTTLDKSQWIGKAHQMEYDIPVMSDAQFLAIACGADPYKIAQLTWHNGDSTKLLEKMGIDWRTSKKSFDEYVESIKKGGEVESLYRNQPGKFGSLPIVK